jgi:Single-stranded DNA-binding protein
MRLEVTESFIACMNPSRNGFLLFSFKDSIEFSEGRAILVNTIGWTIPEASPVTSMNYVHLVGVLTKAPEFRETAARKPYARLSVETETYRRVNGERRRISHLHTVVCFNQFSLPVLRGMKAGQRVKVLGELTYDRGGKAEVWVHQYSGEVGPMDAPDDASANEAAPARAADQAPSAPQTNAKPSGGLGRLPQARPVQDSEPNPAPEERSQPRRLSDDDLDDEIPF